MKDRDFSSIDTTCVREVLEFSLRTSRRELSFLRLSHGTFHIACSTTFLFIVTLSAVTFTSGCRWRENFIFGMSSTQSCSSEGA